MGSRDNRMNKEQILDIFSRLTVEDAAEILANAWQEGRLSEEREEREAWDRYASAVLTRAGMDETGNFCAYSPLEAARHADAMLSERRKRFGGKE